MNSSSKRFFCGAGGVVAAFLLVGYAGCDAKSPSADKPSPPVNTSAPKPDNTGKNERDIGTANPTAQDQGQTQRDLDITAEIRKAVMADATMSINGQNCKIITMAGVVTLRGPVESQSEKDSIAAKAKAVAGVTSVMNELEVKPR